jgi:PAS domain S-box-containing protein
MPDGKLHRIAATATPVTDDDGRVVGGVLVVRDVVGRGLGGEVQQRGDVEGEEGAAVEAVELGAGEAAVGDESATLVVRKAYAELDRRAGERRLALVEAASALRQSTALLENFAASTPELIFVRDRERRILMVNPAMLRALGRTRDEVIGQDAILFGNPDEAERIHAVDRRVLDSGEAVSVEERQLTPAGMRTYLVTKSPLRDDRGRIIGLVGVATDITERNRTQHELEHLLMAEHRLRGEAERASRAKDDFLALVSHELRSPLNALKGWAHVLSSATRPDPFLITRATEAIKRNVEHQARLIDDLLDTSRIISGKLEIERRPLDFVEVVQAAIDLARDSAQAKQIALRFAADEASLAVVGDPGRLQQVVINLLSNAVKFTPAGGCVDIALRRFGGRVELSVSDTGIGIEPTFLPHVFNRFSQADSSTVRRYCGLGIGLALVRYLVELHGGRISAASPGPGRGATFTAELPASESELTAAAAAAGAQRLLPGDALRGIRVLLVDDDDDAREAMQIALKSAGGDVLAFDSGRALLAGLHAGAANAAATVLVLDIAMPDEDGFGVLAGVRGREGASFIPAIAVTALTYLDSKQFASAGFQASIGKPVDIDRLIEAIATLAGRYGGAHFGLAVPV